MADDAERMTALKRAYADIILNTAKESAGRILASERRVLQLQRSLSLAKEESLAMLLRLKTIMDAKLNESEKANLSQGRKIQELECQLTEAKVTIDYLRFEVRRLNSEFDHNDAIPEKNNAQGNRDNSDSLSHSLNGPKGMQNWFTKDEACGHPLKNLIASDNYAGNPDLACILLSNKEPELYRNGCTQRIRAFEQNSVSSKDLPAQIHDQASNTKGDVIVHENDKNEGSSIRNSDTAEKVVRKRNRRRRKFVMWSTKCVTHHDMKHDRSLDSNHPKVEQNDQHGSADNKHRTDNVVPLKILQSCSSQVSGEDPTIDKCSGHVNGNRMMTRRSVLKLCNSCSNHADKNHTPSNGSCCRESGLKEPFLVGASEVIDNVPMNVDVKDSTLIEQKILMRPGHRLAEDPDTVTKEDYETINDPQNDYKDEHCRSSLPSAVAGSDKILKYTFQRKRKRGSLDSKVESTALEENCMSRRKVDKDNALSETQKSSSLIGESSRDSRRMAQVARQLISLSERRWW